MRAAWFVGVAAIVWTAGDAFAAEGSRAMLDAALATITADELGQHVNVLADDTYEGREAGSRGGHAAGGYLRSKFQEFDLAPAGDNGGHFQAFGGGYRNILGMLEGSDPVLRNEVIVVSAHYDHVGYGTPSNSYGPTGYIHNGADDNASGTAALLETAQALASLEERPKRSILFALWDGEEKGLLGSKHWVEQPTVPFDRVKTMTNMDMVGRLRDKPLEVSGARSLPGLRRLVSEANRDPELALAFTWEMKDNSDHYPFYSRGVPIVMLHTGLHDDYHRPSDDAHKIDAAGMEKTSRLLASVIHDLANLDELPGFRTAARRESPGVQRMVERPLAPPPGRLGVRWDPADKAAPGLRINDVRPGSPAAQAGLRVGDRVVKFGDAEIAHDDDLAAFVLAAASPVTAAVSREGEEDPLELSIELAGKPVELGFSWRADDAEPTSVKVVRVVGHSAAERAGLRLFDRIHSVGGQQFSSLEEFHQLVAAAPRPVELVIERAGQVQPLTIDPALRPAPSEGSL